MKFRTRSIIMALTAFLLCQFSVSVFGAGTTDSRTSENHSSRFTRVVYNITKPDSGITDPDDCVDNETITGSTVTATIAAQPDVPRNLIFQIVDASGASGNLQVLFVVDGKNALGYDVTATTLVSNVHTTTSAGVYYNEGSVPFATISSITATSIGFATTGTSDTFNIGFRSKLGLPVPIGSASDIFKAQLDGVDETLGTRVVLFNTYEPATAIPALSADSTSAQETIFVEIAGDQTADPDDIVDAHDINTSPTGAMVIDGQTDTARNLLYNIIDTGGDSADFATTFTAVGLDQFGVAVTETVAVSDTDGATVSTTVAGSAIFATVTSVTLADTTGEESGDFANVGVGEKLGFQFLVSASGDVIKATFNGVNETVGTVNTTYYSYDPTGSLTSTVTVATIYDQEELIATLAGNEVFDPDDIVDAHDIVTSPSGAMVIALQTDWPRVLKYNIFDHTGDSSDFATTFTTVGTDQFGGAITEIVPVSDTDGATTSTTVVGTTAFATITSISLSGTTGEGNSDTANVGVGEILGFQFIAAASGNAEKATFNNVDETVGTVNTTYYTYDPTGTVDGSDTVQLWWNKTTTTTTGANDTVRLWFQKDATVLSNGGTELTLFIKSTFTETEPPKTGIFRD